MWLVPAVGCSSHEGDNAGLAGSRLDGRGRYGGQPLPALLRFGRCRFSGRYPHSAHHYHARPYPVRFGLSLPAGRGAHSQPAAVGGGGRHAEGCGAGGPLSVFFIAIITAEFGKLISGITKIDILITPLLTIIVGCGLAIGIAPWIGKGAYYIGDAINRATDLQPFIMGIIVSVAIGVILTLPISSAAICASFGILGLAGGAALAGCCCQMVGFAVQSFKANKWSGLVSQGIGTSMLQMPNIVKKPIIWLPTILASAITGPIATCVFKLQMNGPAISSGMGTCGLVGPIGVVQGWFNDIDAGLKTNITALDISGLILVSLVLPIVLTLIFHFIFKKFKLYSDDDLKLNL